MANGYQLDPLPSLLVLLLPISLLVLLYFIVRPIKIHIKSRLIIIIIVGGSISISLALAHRAAFESARVSILARNQSKFDEAREAIHLTIGIDVAVFSAARIQLHRPRPRPPHRLEGTRLSILACSESKLEEAREAIHLATGIDIAIFSADARDFDVVKKAIDEFGSV